MRYFFSKQCRCPLNNKDEGLSPAPLKLFILYIYIYKVCCIRKNTLLTLLRKILTKTVIKEKRQ